MDLKEKSLQYHRTPKPGKLEIAPSKPCATKEELSLAYTPGVAFPCLEIKNNPEASYEYTSRGNTVGIITDGSAVLGLGNIGAAASIPVMEGKSVLLKKLAGLDGIPLALKDFRNTDELAHIITMLETNFGLINLEDIKAPECFILLNRLTARLTIPVFHDDQDGTAVIVLAALWNSLALLKKSINKIQIVINGAGAAGIACARLFVAAGVPRACITLVDRKGVINRARTDANEFKKEFTSSADTRTLSDALRGADVFLGVSCPRILTESMIKSMNARPIIFALANPDPEVLPEEARQWGAAIVATGRSDFPNQVNNALGFPGIFRGTLDVRAKNINTEMKLAAAHALAKLAQQPIPSSVYNSCQSSYPLHPFDPLHPFSPTYIVPSPFDPRVVPAVARAVAGAAEKTGVAQVLIEDFEEYEKNITASLSLPT